MKCRIRGLSKSVEKEIDESLQTMSHWDTFGLEYGLSSRARQTTYVQDAYAPSKRRAEPAGPRSPVICHRTKWNTN